MADRPPRLTIPAVLLLAVIGAIPAAGQSRKQAKEPSFQDRPLSSWVADLKSAAPLTRNAAAYAIGGMAADAAPAVPALIAVLENKDEVLTVKYPVMVALREIGPGAKAAIPALTVFLDDRNDEMVGMARKAIKAITGTDPRPPADE